MVCCLNHKSSRYVIELDVRSVTLLVMNFAYIAGLCFHKFHLHTFVLF